MDNKALADFIRTELSKVTSALNKLAVKISELAHVREQHNTTISPQSTTTHENNSAQRQLPLPPHIPPTPRSSPQPQKPWYKTMNGWKTLLECIAIPFAIGYAAVTYQQWRDLRHNFEVDQRAWLKIGSRFSNVTNETEVATAILNPINIGKSPILEAFMDVTSELLPVDKAPSLNLGAQHDRLMMSSIFPGGEPPNDIELRVPSSKAASEYPRKLTRPEVQGLINGTLYVALFGRVVYADQFGKHWQRFCAWHTYEQPPVTIMIVNAKSCVAWNAVGEGDPTK